MFYLQFCASKHAKFAGLEKGVEDKRLRTEQDKARCAVTLNCRRALLLIASSAKTLILSDRIKPWRVNLNSSPFVIQYIILSNKWGAVHWQTGPLPIPSTAWPMQMGWKCFFTDSASVRRGPGTENFLHRHPLFYEGKSGRGNRNPSFCPMQQGCSVIPDREEPPQKCPKKI